VTTPIERYRSVTRLHEMLKVAVAEESLSEQLLVRAHSLLKNYPSEEAFFQLVLTKRQGLSQDIADRLDEAISWLQDVGEMGPPSDDLRNWHRWIVRHFPEPWEIGHQRQSAGRPRSVLWPSIDQWMHP
jgi:hypothetical protein